MDKQFASEVEYLSVMRCMFRVDGFNLQSPAVLDHLNVKNRNSANPYAPLFSHNKKSMISITFLMVSTLLELFLHRIVHCLVGGRIQFIFKMMEMLLIQ